ncbi:hypothetical protein BC629DRAFT_140921 [Irpex lacteus]|nr:hypothetical protein BC629DRAFT_872834 [Irpex lacteus]KAI0801832.1 hypothetical protein BC629DRAFT_140921 [Irpex lacteus]
MARLAAFHVLLCSYICTTHPFLTANIAYVKVSYLCMDHSRLILTLFNPILPTSHTKAAAMLTIYLCASDFLLHT